jgi:hypothetical protein
LNRTNEHELLLSVAEATGLLATFCDRLEHGESDDRAHVRSTGLILRDAAITYASAAGLDIYDLYAQRLARAERSHVLGGTDSFQGELDVRAAQSWRDLQLVQVAHDRRYRPDVFGLSRYDQLRHCALHLAKLTATAAALSKDLSLREDFVERRLPDVLLFGLKVATLADHVLSDESLPKLPVSPVAERLKTDQER